MSELISRPEEREAVNNVVCTLADARLLTTSADEHPGKRWVDVSHEALIRGWPALRQWIEEDRAGLRVHRRLTEAAQEWQRLRQDEGVLYRGARLVEAAEWREGHEASLNSLERGFLNASVELRDREQAAREKERRRLQEALEMAEQQRQIAVQQAARAESRALVTAAIENLGRDAELSVLLALEAVSKLRSAGKMPLPEVEDILHRSVRASRIQRTVTLTGHTGTVEGVAFSPDGQRIATASDDQTAKVWDAASGKELLTLKGHTGPVWGLAFSPDGKRIAAATRRR